MKRNLLIINGSRSGLQGQSHTIANFLISQYKNDWNIDQLTLLIDKNVEIWESKLKSADAFIFLSGTYWDSWGSPLQFFLEESTHFEATDLWMGKPAAVIITMHSIGGKGVLSRLQGVLGTLGLFLPPLTGMVYSLNSHLVLKSDEPNEHAPDLWSLDDIKILMANLLLATEALSPLKKSWKKWPVDKEFFSKKWLFEKDFNS